VAAAGGGGTLAARASLTTPANAASALPVTPPSPLSHPLTSRQCDVLRGLAGGLSNKEIASRLHLSEATVKRHVADILTRLELPTRAAAAAWATRHGLA
jgi:DNA-binding NarL/FixJ family response regulator